jgi:hypothetical protein
MTRRWGCAFALALLFGCSSHQGEDVAAQASGLTVPGLLPVPAKVVNGQLQQTQWDGDSVDLMVADAWAGCSFPRTTRRARSSTTPSTTVTWSV